MHGATHLNILLQKHKEIEIYTKKLENIKIRHVPLLGDAELEDRMHQIKDPLK